MTPKSQRSTPQQSAIWRQLWTLFLPVAALGCTDSATSIDPQVVAGYQQRFLLDEEPLGAMAVLDVRELFTGPLEEIHDHSQSEEEGAEEEIEFTAADFEDERDPPMVSLEPQRVVMVGQIGGMPSPFGESEPDFPWKKNLATFFIVDPGTLSELTASGHSHEADCDCPFCARHATDHSTSVAVVNLVEEDGTAIKLPADQLLGVREQETVVVTGTARLLGGEVLVIDADGVYVRR